MCTSHQFVQNVPETGMHDSFVNVCQGSESQLIITNGANPPNQTEQCEAK